MAAASMLSKRRGVQSNAATSCCVDCCAEWSASSQPKVPDCTMRCLQRTRGGPQSDHRHSRAARCDATHSTLCDSSTLHSSSSSP